MKIKFSQITRQTRYILAELIIGTLFIAMIAFVSISNIQNKMDRTYADFAQLMTESIAAQVAGHDNMPVMKKSKLLSEQFKPFLIKNDDVAYIEYKDRNNDIVYSSKKETPFSEDDILMSVTSPVIFKNMKTGSITVGLTGRGINLISSTTQKTLFGIFFLTWFIFAIILLLNMVLTSKELKKIHDGVRQIATGKFGYQLESENMKELTDAFNDMSSVLSKYEEQNIEQLTLERNKLEAVLMSIINGVIVCDNYDRVVLANSAALKMLDIEERNFIGTKIQNYVDSHEQTCFRERIEEFKDTPLNVIEQKPIEFNIEAGKLTIKSMISPMFSQQQDYVGYIIVLIDITRETEVNKLKNTFISNVSHELRTPVTVLRTYIDTLCNNGDDFDEETKKEFMGTIDVEVKRLHSMVNEILDFSRLESGNIKLRKEYCNISELIQKNISSIKILAEEKNLTINYSENENVPNAPVNVESMDRVVRNLLSNAIKYSDEGKSIDVNLCLTEDKQYVKFSVTDHGIGIAKEHLEKIFDRFYRVENATHTIKGTGLGLHLVKVTVEKHHYGKVYVSSKEGEGSVFTVELPLNIDENELV